MKKVLIGIVVILFVAVVGTPIINGIVMEKVIKRVYHDINTLHAASGSDVSVQIVKYERNLYSSEIEWKVKLNNLKSAYGVEEVVFHDQVDHGFLGVVSTTSMDKNSWYADFVKDKLGGKDPLHITTEYRLFGNITSTVRLDAFSVKSQGKVFAVQPASVITSCDKELKNFSTQASWDGISVPDEVTVGKMTLNSRLKKISTYIWAGKVSFALEKGWAVVNSERFELANFINDYVLTFDKKKNILSITLSAGADLLKAGDDKIENGFVRLGIHNLDGTAYEEFMQSYAKTVNSLFEDMAGAEDNPEKLKAIVDKHMSVMGAQTMVAYEKLLKKDLEFTVTDLHATVKSGEITGDLSLRLKQNMTFMQFFPIISHPSLALDIFSLNSSLNLPAELVGDEPMLLAPLYPGMETGLFEKDGDYLRHKAETKDGKLFLNGHEVLLKKL